MGVHAVGRESKFLEEHKLKLKVLSISLNECRWRLMRILMKGAMLDEQFITIFISWRTLHTWLMKAKLKFVEVVIVCYQPLASHTISCLLLRSHLFFSCAGPLSALMAPSKNPLIGAVQHLLKNGQSSDFTIITCDGNKIKTHKLVLICHRTRNQSCA